MDFLVWSGFYVLQTTAYFVSSKIFDNLLYNYYSINMPTGYYMNILLDKLPTYWI